MDYSYSVLGKVEKWGRPPTVIVMLYLAANSGEVSLLLPGGLLLAGLVLIGAEFFLPTVILGFAGAVVSFVGIYLSAGAGVVTCGVFSGIFILVLTLEFVGFRWLLPRTGIGRSMINASSNAGSAVPAAAGYAFMWAARAARSPCSRPLVRSKSMARASKLFLLMDLWSVTPPSS